MSLEDNLDSEFKWLELFTKLSLGVTDYNVSVDILKALPPARHMECIRSLEKSLDTFLRTLPVEESKVLEDHLIKLPDDMEYLVERYSKLSGEQRQSLGGYRLADLIVRKKWELSDLPVADESWKAFMMTYDVKWSGLSKDLRKEIIDGTRTDFDHYLTGDFSLYGLKRDNPDFQLHIVDETYRTLIKESQRDEVILHFEDTDYRIQIVSPDREIHFESDYIFIDEHGNKVSPEMDRIIRTILR